MLAATEPDIKISSVGDAAAGAIWALMHILGLEPDHVHRLTVDPDAGMITAEVWNGKAEPDPRKAVGGLRPSVDVCRWSYRTPEAIALDLITRAAG